MMVGCQPYAPAASTPRKCSFYSFLLEAESTPGIAVVVVVMVMAVVVVAMVMAEVVVVVLVMVIAVVVVEEAKFLFLVVDSIYGLFTLQTQRRTDRPTICNEL